MWLLVGEEAKSSTDKKAEACTRWVVASWDHSNASFFQRCIFLRPNTFPVFFRRLLDRREGILGGSFLCILLPVHGDLGVHRINIDRYRSTGDLMVRSSSVNSK